MSDDKKSVWGAYGMASLALITGVMGFPRYYLKQRLRGTLMSVLFLGGLLIVVYHYIGIYVGIAAQAVDALSGLGSGQVDFAQIPSFDANTLAPTVSTYFGFVCCGLGLAWWFVDLFLLPSAVKKYNLQTTQRVADGVNPTSGVNVKIDAAEIRRQLEKNQ